VLSNCCLLCFLGAPGKQPLPHTNRGALWGQESRFSLGPFVVKCGPGCAWVVSCVWRCEKTATPRQATPPLPRDRTPPPTVCSLRITYIRSLWARLHTHATEARRKRGVVKRRTTTLLTEPSPFLSSPGLAHADMGSAQGWVGGRSFVVLLLQSTAQK